MNAIDYNISTATTKYVSLLEIKINKKKIFYE